MDSLEDTKAAIDTSHKNITETEEIIDNIRTVAGNVRNEGDQMGNVINRCDGEIMDVAQHIEGTQQYFDDVANNVEDLKDKLLKKEDMFADMSQALEKINPLVDKIAKDIR